jgi:hypothetical protein
VAETRGQTLAIVGGERHEDVELALEIGAPRHWLLLAPLTVPEQTPKHKCRLLSPVSECST